MVCVLNAFMCMRYRLALFNYQCEYVCVCTDVHTLLLYSYWQRVALTQTQCEPSRINRHYPWHDVWRHHLLSTFYIRIVHILPPTFLCACVFYSLLCYCLLVLPCCHVFFLVWDFFLRSMYVSFQHSGFLFFFSVFSMIAFCGIFVLVSVPSSLIRSLFQL